MSDVQLCKASCRCCFHVCQQCALKVWLLLFLCAATEVEAVLYAHPAVHQAAVFGVPSRVMGELVGAAVTLRPNAAAVRS